MAHSSGSTLLCSHEITHTKNTTFPKFQAHERKGRQHSSNNDPFEKNTCKIAHDAVSLYLPPSVCQTRNNQTQTEHPYQKKKTRSAQNNQKNLEKTQSKSQSQKQTTELHHNTTYNRPPHAHNTNALNKLIRFVVSCGDHVHRRRTCRCHTERKLHDRHHSTMTETHPTRK